MCGAARRSQINNNFPIDKSFILCYPNCVSTDSTLKQKGDVFILLHIDYTASQPLHQQIEEQICSLIATGMLRPNDWLPSVRQLATDISINPNTVQRAYASLEEKGVIVSVKGRGSFVSPDLSAIDRIYTKNIDSMLREVITKAALAGWSKDRIYSEFSKVLEEEATQK